MLMLDDTRMQALELAAQGYSCAQIVMEMGLRLMGRQNPDLTRAMSALSMGARYGAICGALTGGLCLIAMHTAKGFARERPLPMSTTLMGALTKWFIVDELGGEIEPDCAEIFESRGYKFDLSSGPAASCADLVARTWDKTVAILRENDIDPVLGRKDLKLF